MPALVTARLRLVPITLDGILAVLDADKERAEAIVGAKFPDSWPSHELLVSGFPYSRDAIKAAPDTRLWGDSLILLKSEPLVIGSVVFHGHPCDGVAEVGYAIQDSYRAKGYATEATRACVEWALEQAGIEAVQATTFEWHLASLGVIRGVGMKQVAVRDHDTLGSLLVFERRRE
jgi:RimJ/RimL family protein N-acetyltransferase